MSIEDDVALLARVPTLRLLGGEALRMLAIGSEQRRVGSGEFLFKQGDEADCGYVVQGGAFRINDGLSAETVAEPGTLIGELALVVAMRRPSNAEALEQSWGRLHFVSEISREPFDHFLSDAQKVGFLRGSVDLSHLVEVP